MEAKAILRHTRVSPQKTRLLADQVRSRQIADALRMLNLLGTKRARVIAKVLNSAVANAMQTGMVDVDNLYVKSIQVDEGPMICLLYTSPSPRDRTRSRMPSSA